MILCNFLNLGEGEKNLRKDCYCVTFLPLPSSQTLAEDTPQKGRLPQMKAHCSLSPEVYETKHLKNIIEKVKRKYKFTLKSFGLKPFPQCRNTAFALLFIYSTNVLFLHLL